MVTGDGDGLSIGETADSPLNAGTLISISSCSIIRYTGDQGQYSPLREEHKVTKSTPFGSIDHPFNPLALAMGADVLSPAPWTATPKHLQSMLLRPTPIKALLSWRSYQNCNIFNDGKTFDATEKGSKSSETLFLEHGQPLVLEPDKTKRIKLDGFKPVIVDLTEVPAKTTFDSRRKISTKPRYWCVCSMTRICRVTCPAFGVFYETERACYEIS